jgi:hypothetical protein
MLHKVLTIFERGLAARSNKIIVLNRIYAKTLLSTLFYNHALMLAYQLTQFDPEISFWLEF